MYCLNKSSLKKLTVSNPLMNVILLGFTITMIAGNSPTLLRYLRAFSKKKKQISYEYTIDCDSSKRISRTRCVITWQNFISPNIHIYYGYDMYIVRVWCILPRRVSIKIYRTRLTDTATLYVVYTEMNIVDGIYSTYIRRISFDCREDNIRTKRSVNSPL